MKYYPYFKRMNKEKNKEKENLDYWLTNRLFSLFNCTSGPKAC